VAETPLTTGMGGYATSLDDARSEGYGILRAWKGRICGGPASLFILNSGNERAKAVRIQRR
jgi:hypothetical protein